MKKILLIAALVAVSGSSAFAGSINYARVYNTGFFNVGSVVQGGGYHTINTATVTNFGAGNVAGIKQLGDGPFTVNNAATFQFGVGNGAFILQN
ncbi:MAG: hypothetical protein ABSC72_12530 [Methylovirgula sp.]|jgi:hypothetical protein